MPNIAELELENQKLKVALETARASQAALEVRLNQAQTSHLFLTQRLDDANVKIRLLQKALFGSKSETYKAHLNEAQLELFALDTPQDLNPEESEPDTSTQELEQDSKGPGAADKRRGGRRELPKHLHRRVVVLDLEPAEKVCDCGQERTKIGENATEVLERIPAKYYVTRFVRYTYACPNPNCECLLEGRSGVMKTAPKPHLMIPRSMAGHSLLANVLAAKFVDGMPFYRISKSLEREGIKLPRETMSRWAAKVAMRLKPLWERLLRDIKAESVLQMDETVVQVLNEKDRSNTSKSYMWVIRGGPPDQPITLYRYDPSRSSTVAQEFPGNDSGIVQTDGYSGYKFLDRKGSRCLHAGCMQHARRMFTNVLTAAGKKRKPGFADQVLKGIGKLYRTERQARDQAMTAADRKALRQKHSKPRMEKLHEMLQKQDGKTPPTSLLGKAITYTLNQWPRLEVFLDHGDVEIDNNLIENDIRPFVIGRKAWLFAGGPGGAEASAILYSMMVTAKHNGWDPYRWMVHTFDRLPAAEGEDDLRRLLPTQSPEVIKDLVFPAT